jgi:hypothetical protein
LNFQHPTKKRASPDMPYKLSGARLGVVGIDEKSQVFGTRTGEFLERGSFIVVGLDEGMRRAEGRDTPAVPNILGLGSGLARRPAGTSARSPLRTSR